MSHFSVMEPGAEPAWVQFFSHPTYTPYLRPVSTDIITDEVGLSVKPHRTLLEILCSFEKGLKDRNVVFKGLADEKTSFALIDCLQRDTHEVSMSCLVMDGCTSVTETWGPSGPTLYR